MEGKVKGCEGVLREFDAVLAMMNVLDRRSKYNNATGEFLIY